MTPSNPPDQDTGVPLFQEQLMQIAVDAAGFSPAEADTLRQAMGAKRSIERMDALRDKLIAGMRSRGIDSPTAEKIYSKLRSFAEFGFPESHAFSFAYLVYASAWLKVRKPEDFYAGVLAAQPMASGPRSPSSPTLFATVCASCPQTSTARWRRPPSSSGKTTRMQTDQTSGGRSDPIPPPHLPLTSTMTSRCVWAWPRSRAWGSGLRRPSSPSAVPTAPTVTWLILLGV